MSQDKPSAALDIPSQTFEKFMEKLKDDGVSSDVIQNLRKTILEKGNLSESAIRAALFGEDQNP